MNPYGGHPILRRKASDAYAAVVKFLTECTDWDGVWRDNEVESSTPQPFITPDARNDAIVAELAKKLGRFEQGTATSKFNPTGGDSELIATNQKWTVPARLHDWVLEQVLSAPPARHEWMAPICYTCSLSFRLREPGSGKLLPGQTANEKPHGIGVIRSRILLFVSSGNTSAFFDLVLPFAEPNRMFIEYLTRLRPFLPIRLAKGKFRRAVPTKREDGYVYRRIDAKLFAGL